MSAGQAAPTSGGVGRQIATLLTGTTLVQALGLLVSPLVARLYGPLALGQVTAAGVVAGTVATIAPLAMDAAIVLVDTDEEASELAGFVMTSALVVGTALPLAVWGLASFLTEVQSLQFLRTSPLFWSFFLGATAILACSLQALTSLAVRHQNFVAVSSSRVTQSIVTQGLTVGLGFLSAGAMGAAAALLAGQFISSLMVLVSLRRQTRPFSLPRLPHFARLKALLLTHRRYPLYTYPHALLDSFRENAIIAAIAGAGGAAGLGHWALVSRTVRGPTSLLGSAFSQVFTARASESARSRRPLEPIMRWVMLRLGLAAFAGTAVLMFLGPPLFGLVFGAEWEQAGNVARLMVPWIAINLVASPFAYLSYLLRMNRTYLIWAIFYDCSLIAVCAVAPTFFGFTGTLASISTVGTTLMVAILAWQFSAGRRFDTDLKAHPPG